MSIILTYYDDKITLDLSTFSKDRINHFKSKAHSYIDVYDSTRYHDIRYTRFHTWDGKTALFDAEHMSVPIGLGNKLKKFLKEEYPEESLTIKDLRTSPITPTLPEVITLRGNGVEKDLTLREHQYDAVTKSFLYQLGIIEQATNAGKSAAMIAILQYGIPLIKGQALLIAPNLGVAEQLHTKLEHYLGTSCGYMYGGKCNLTDKVTVATIQSLASHLKKPDIKFKDSKGKRLQRFYTYFNSLDTTIGIRKALKLFISNFNIKYKYQKQDMNDLQNLLNTYRNDKMLALQLKIVEDKYNQRISSDYKKELHKYQETVDFLKNVNIVLADEIQGASSNSYTTVFKCLTHARMRIGFTGTIPKQAEKKLKIKALFGEVISSISNKEMISKGYSTKLYIKLLQFNTPNNLDEIIERELVLQRVPRNQQHLKRYQLATELGIINNSQRNKSIAQLALNLAQQEQVKSTNLATLILVNSIEHGEHIIEELDNLNSNISYEFIHGDTPQEERLAAFKRLETGKTGILIGSKILDAGIDLPFLKNIIYVSGGKSYVQVLQRLGRLLRTMDGKDYCVLYDIIDRESEKLFEHAQQRIKYYQTEGFPIIE